MKIAHFSDVLKNVVVAFAIALIEKILVALQKKLLSLKDTVKVLEKRIEERKKEFAKQKGVILP